jgi:hypothetical protein
MKTNTFNKISLFVGLSLVAFLPYLACSSRQGNGPSGSSSPSSNPLLYGSSGQAIASCSKDPGTFTDLSVNLMTFATNGVQNTNYIRVKFNAMPSQFANANGYMAFFVWTVDGAGNPTTPQMAPFAIERYNGVGSFVTASTNMTYVSWPNLQQTAVSAGISASSVQTVASNLDYVIQLDSSNLSGMTVLQPTFYYSSTSSPDHYVSALIPNFYANPTVYAQGHSILQLQLHPFYGNMNSGYTETQFASMAQALCF